MKTTKTFKFKNRKYLIEAQGDRVALKVDREVGLIHYDPIATGEWNGLNVMWDKQFMLSLHMDLIAAVDDECYEMDAIGLLVASDE